jgi:hypothetical protein
VGTRDAYLRLPRLIVQHSELGVVAAVAWATFREVPTDGDGWAAAGLGEWCDVPPLSYRWFTDVFRRLRHFGLVEARSADSLGFEIRLDRHEYGALCTRWKRGAS